MRRADSLGTVALPETRQLDVLAGLLERRSVEVLRCPLVAILDAPQQADVQAWLRRLIDRPPELLIVYTGEGIYRLTAAAERCGLRDDFVGALEKTAILTRGPKPVKALKTLNVSPRHAAETPTTDGIIATLRTLAVEGKRVAVQYYGAQANTDLAAYLESCHADVDAVMPYVYASESDDRAVTDLIRGLCDARIDAIAFTSKAQVQRLFSVAQRTGLGDMLANAMQHCIVAAVGPVVAEELREYGCVVDVMPESSFFMKPLVTLLVDRLSKE